MHEPAVAVADELHLDVLRAFDELFEEDVGDAEGGTRFTLGGVERGFELIRAVNDAHAATATAHRGLHDDRVAEFLGEELCVRDR